MMGLTESVAWEVANYNIRVMSICPGEVDTNMQEDVDPHYYELNKHKMLHPKTVAEKIIDMVFEDNKVWKWSFSRSTKLKKLILEYLCEYPSCDL